MKKQSRINFFQFIIKKATWGEDENSSNALEILKSNDLISSLKELDLNDPNDAVTFGLVGKLLGRAPEGAYIQDVEVTVRLPEFRSVMDKYLQICKEDQSIEDQITSYLDNGNLLQQAEQIINEKEKSTQKLFKSLGKMFKETTSTAKPEPKKWSWKPLDWISTAQEIIKFAENKRSQFRNLPIPIPGVGETDIISACRNKLSSLNWSSISGPDARLCHMLQVLILANKSSDPISGFGNLWQNFAKLTGNSVPGISIVPLLKEGLQGMGYNPSQIEQIRKAWGGLR